MSWQCIVPELYGAVFLGLVGHHGDGGHADVATNPEGDDEADHDQDGLNEAIMKGARSIITFDLPGFSHAPYKSANTT